MPAELRDPPPTTVLAASEGTLRALLENTTDSIFMVDADRRIVAANSNFVRDFFHAYGVALEVGADGLQSLPAETAATWKGLYARALAGEEIATAFSERIQGEARHYDVRLSPVREAGRVVGVTVVSRDVTAQRIMEEAARASEAGLRAILENTPDCIWSVDRDYRLVAFNGAWERDVAQTFGSVIRVGEVVMTFFPEVIRPMWTAFYDRAFAGEHFIFEYSTGEPGRFFEVSFSPIEAQGQVIGACIQSREVTARKRAEEALRSTEQKLYFADRMVTVGTLAAGVAHEINNPLAYVYSHVELLAHQLGKLDTLAPDQRAPLLETLAVVQDGAERIRVIVHDLGTFSRVDEESEPAIVDVHEVLDVALKMAAVEIRHRAHVQKDYGDPPAVRANPARLGQVILNLLVNAAQAIEEGAVERNRITLRTRADHAGRAVIEIGDSGCGIPESLQKRIFDPFFTTKPVGMGTGLGLSICHGIVSGMGGELTMESTVGAGTTFRVALPPGTATARRSSSKTMVADPAPALSTPKVLLVDDEPHLLSSWRQILDGFDTVTCTTAAEALEALAAERFDAVVCDIMMPDRTGMDLYEEMRARWPGTHERVLFVSGGVVTQRAREFLVRSGAPLLKKPFASQVLVTAVHSMITRAATAR
jgi:two-component system cell cycle sensor histidine kinase/response regulator CckA